MAEVSTEVAVGQVMAVLLEGFEGPPEKWSYFTDQGPEAGLFGTLGKLDAAAASQATGGSTIAAHVHHLVFSLDASASWIRGERIRHDWPLSWSVTTVDEAAWHDLVERLRAGYQELRRTFEAHAADGLESFGGAVGAVAHAAYHLGAIRQKVLFERQP
jgi:hypothetical protein